MFGQNAVLGMVSQGGNGHVRMGIGDWTEKTYCLGALTTEPSSET